MPLINTKLYRPDVEIPTCTRIPLMPWFTVSTESLIGTFDDWMLFKKKEYIAKQIPKSPLTFRGSTVQIQRSRTNLLSRKKEKNQQILPFKCRVAKKLKNCFVPEETIFELNFNCIAGYWTLILVTKKFSTDIIFFRKGTTQPHQLYEFSLNNMTNFNNMTKLNIKLHR